MRKQFIIPGNLNKFFVEVTLYGYNPKYRPFLSKEYVYSHQEIYTLFATEALHSSTVYMETQKCLYNKLKTTLKKRKWNFYSISVGDDLTHRTGYCYI